MCWQGFCRHSFTSARTEHYLTRFTLCIETYCTEWGGGILSYDLVTKGYVVSNAFLFVTLESDVA